MVWLLHSNRVGFCQQTQTWHYKITQTLQKWQTLIQLAQWHAQLQGTVCLLQPCRYTPLASSPHLVSCDNDVKQAEKICVLLRFDVKVASV